MTNAEIAQSWIDVLTAQAKIARDAATPEVQLRALEQCMRAATHAHEALTREAAEPKCMSESPDGDFCERPKGHEGMCFWTPLSTHARKPPLASRVIVGPGADEPKPVCNHEPGSLRCLVNHPHGRSCSNCRHCGEWIAYAPAFGSFDWTKRALGQVR